MPPPQIVSTTSITEEAAFVATGAAVSILPAAAMRYVPHPNIRFLPITDAPGSTVAVAWRSDAAGWSLVEMFHEVACVVRDREVEIVRMLEHPHVLYAEPC